MEKTPLDYLIDDQHGQDLYLHVKIKDKEKASKLFQMMFNQEEFHGVICDKIILGESVRNNKELVLKQIKESFNSFIEDFKVLTDFEENNNG